MKRGGKLVIIIIVAIILIAAVVIALGLKYDIFDFLKKGQISENKSENQTVPEVNTENKGEISTNKTFSNISTNITPIIDLGGGGGGGSSGGDTGNPRTPSCSGVNCNEGYVCISGSCIVKEAVCILAQNNDLCNGLDIAYGDGYRARCNSTYNKC